MFGQEVEVSTLQTTTLSKKQETRKVSLAFICTNSMENTRTHKYDVVQVFKVLGNSMVVS
jgi:hypothetical protein